jgi:hypothetical protein
MTAVSVLPVAGAVFEDVRDDGRSLRVSWHPVDGICVLSMWRDARCVASFQLARMDAADLIHELVQGLAQAPPAPWTVTNYRSRGSLWTQFSRRLRRSLAARLSR